MAHAFKIMNTTGTITTYTDYDSIPLVTLKHVISFIPDLGTKIDSNEILLESETLDSGETDNFVTELVITTIEIELETGTTGTAGENLILDGTDSLSTNVGDDIVMEDVTFLEDKTVTSSDNLVLNGTDSSSTNDESNLIMEVIESRHKLVPEDWSAGSENHLVLETADDATSDITNHYHDPVGPEHVSGDGHTEEEHREIALWNYKLQLLLTRADTNNA